MNLTDYIHAFKVNAIQYYFDPWLYTCLPNKYSLTLLWTLVNIYMPSEWILFNIIVILTDYIHALQVNAIQYYFVSWLYTCISSELVSFLWTLLTIYMLSKRILFNIILNLTDYIHAFSMNTIQHYCEPNWLYKCLLSEYSSIVLWILLTIYMPSKKILFNIMFNLTIYMPSQRILFNIVVNLTDYICFLREYSSTSLSTLLTINMPPRWIISNTVVNSTDHIHAF